MKTGEIESCIWCPKPCGKTLIKIICCQCKKHIGFKNGKGESGVSHGLCRACYKLWNQKI